LPFGGYKMSGYGRESGKQHLEEYLNVKAVWIKTGLASYLAPLAGERSDSEAIQVRGNSPPNYSVFCGSSPSPRPSQSELCSSRPRKNGARGRRNSGVGFRPAHFFVPRL